jgi:hypothetical protein
MTRTIAAQSELRPLRVIGANSWLAERDHPTRSIGSPPTPRRSQSVSLLTLVAAESLSKSSWLSFERQLVRS